MSATIVESHAAGIWQRVLHPEVGDFPPDAARRFLEWDFADTDKKRADELAAKARAGTLSEAEQHELRSFMVVDAFLSIVHAKAQLSLRQAGLEQ
jgi:hypothetical protein